MGRVTRALGAGNVFAIPMLDTLYSSIADGDVVVLKMNPVNESYGPVFEQMALVDPRRLRADRLRWRGRRGAPHGQRECRGDPHHRQRTHLQRDRFGPGADGSQRKATGHAVLTKPIRAELGGVGPTIVLPGPWTDADIAYQADISPPRSCTTQVTPAWRPRCWCCRRNGTAGSNCSTRSGRHSHPLPTDGRSTLARTTNRRHSGAEYPGRGGTCQRPAADADDGPGSRIRSPGIPGRVLRTHLRHHDTAWRGRRGVPPQRGQFANDHLHGNLGANRNRVPQAQRRHSAQSWTMPSRN